MTGKAGGSKTGMVEHNMDRVGDERRKVPLRRWNPVAQLNTSNNNVIEYYVWGSDLSGSMQGAGGVGGLLEVVYYGTQRMYYFVAYDGNGNVAGWSRRGRDQPWPATNTAPSEKSSETGPMAKANPFRFSTKYRTMKTDFLYYGYRYYNPSTGRWLSRDPIGEGDGLNLYGLVHNSPMNAIDYLGLVCECAFRTTIKPGDKINKLEEGILVFGHHFDVDIDIDYIKGEGLATLEWWEQTDNVPLDTVIW